MDWTREIEIKNVITTDGFMWLVASVDGQPEELRFCGLVDEVIAEIS